MRFTVAILALPLLASAADFEQYKAQFNGLFDTIGSYLPNPAKAASPVSDAQAKAGSLVVHELTLSNWKDTLYGSVTPGQQKPEEWWVFITGRNKTCYGRCDRVTKAFNESAAKIAITPGAPHLGMINCEDQPVLCNSWSAIPSSIWDFKVLPPPAPVDIHVKRMNMSTATVESFTDLLKVEVKDQENGWWQHTGTFHPFDGPLAKYGLAVPLGYAIWGLNAFPQWGMMIVLSFFSRWLMNRKINNERAPRAAPANPAAAAPPGDARS